MAILSRVLHHNSEKSNDKPSLKHNFGHNGSLSPVGSSSHYTLSLSINLESPPVILYGQPQDSSGSIISGLLKIDIKSCKNLKSLDLALVSSYSSTTSSHVQSDEIELESVTLVLMQTVKYTKPFLIPSSSVASCKDCCVRKNELAKWDVLISRSSFSPGTHAYPFSHLIPGSLPASSKLGSMYSNTFIKYDLIAVATRPNTPRKVKVILPLNIARLILRGPERNSLRVFPPTETTASAILPNVIYPKSNISLQLRLDNIVDVNNDRLWRMRKLVWKIEEHTKVKATTCPKHESKLKQIEESQRKTTSFKEIKSKNSPGSTNHTNNRPGSNKVSNFHHSTIQTNMFLSVCPSTKFNSSLHALNNHLEGINGAPLISEENDSISSTASSHGHDDLIDDFLSPAPSIRNNNNNNGLSAVSTNSRSGNSHNNMITDLHNAEAIRLENSESLYLDEIRTVTHGVIKRGWKSDFNGRGKIELVTDIDAFDFSTGLNRHVMKISSDDPKIDEVQEGLRNGANVCCDIDDPTLGIHVNHTLIVEVIVAEEIIPRSSERKTNNTKSTPVPLTPVISDSSTSKRKSDSSTNQRRQTNSTGIRQQGVTTGAARVLRMQFKVTLTERSGLGIAWDDEVPPTYQDIRAFSPPTYAETSALVTSESMSISHITTPELSTHVQTSSNRFTEMPTQSFFTLSTRSTTNGTTIDGVVDPDERIQDFTL